MSFVISYEYKANVYMNYEIWIRTKWFRFHLKT